MGGFSIWHILILAIILLLLFGGNRFSSMMGDVAKGIKSFKQGMADDEDESRRRYDEQRRYEDQRRAEPPRLPRDQEPIDVTPRREEAAPPPRDNEPR
jgi:sec-independent protein translocase protein TatA